MIAAYLEPDRAKGRQLMTRLIASTSHDVPAALREIITLGRTLTRRAADILAYFDRPLTGNGAQAIIAHLNQRIAEANIIPWQGPMIITGRLDVDRTLAEWRRRRVERGFSG
jgi:hypothetical protein